MRPEIRRENVSTEASDRSRFLLGSATVDPVDGTVTGPEHSVRLEPRVMEVLIAMSRRAGEVLSREELMNAVWGDTVVTNDVLARCVYQLRSELPRVLGAATADDVIETLRKRGYRLKVAVNPLDTGAIAADPPKKAWTALSALLLTAALAAAAWWWFDTEQSPPIRSIAVLPFVNMTGDPDLESLADGFTEQLSHALANVPQLRVSARTSAFAFKNKDAEIPVIAGRLGVESLLEGSVRRNGAQLRVTVQLIRDDGFHIWSREYDRPHRDILALQSEVSQAVLGELGLAPAAEQASELKKTNYVAYDLYLRGRLEMKAGGEDKFPRAIALFERAINEDPEYPLAYSGLADAYSLQLWGVSAPDEAAWAKIDEAIDRALSLDDRLAEAHASRGLRLYMSKQYVEAESHLRHAVSLNPNYVAAWVWLGLDLVLQDRFSEASEVYQRAQLLDPLNPGLNRNLGANLLLAGRPDEGFTYLERATQIAPDHPQAYRMIAWWAVHYGRLPVALSWAQDGLER
ncbi:MAG: winged helix-turn-helix domain-containing protein, partial [Xanthomonadales bacterium]|nr:winged helix-turn-helix domain-containing protein [Xanthomonadales bacterium]